MNTDLRVKYDAREPIEYVGEDYECMMSYCHSPADLFYTSSEGLRCFCTPCLPPGGAWERVMRLYDMRKLTHTEFNEALTAQVMED